MLEKILNILTSEDTYKFFTGNAHPSIQDAVSAISNPEDYKEIERALKNYFDQVMQLYPSESQLFSEASRMHTICENFFASSQTIQPSRHQTSSEATDLSNEIVNFYMESLKHFSSSLGEDILFAHIRYLDNE